MHELLSNVVRMRFKSDLSCKVFVFRSTGNELVPLPHKERFIYEAPWGSLLP